VRVMILAAAVLATTTLAAVAAPWSDPAGRLVFETPSGWMVAPQQANGMTYVVAGGMASECHLIAAPREATAETSPHRLRLASQQQLDPDAWTNIAALLPNLFPQNAQVLSQSVETDSFWPVQYADIRGITGRTVHGAIQFRPGYELWTFCLTHDGADDVTTFTQIAHSVGTPNDAQLQAQAELDQREEARNMRAAQLYREGHRANAQRQHLETRQNY
jgi:hypothetical protein